MQFEGVSLRRGLIVIGKGGSIGNASKQAYFSVGPSGTIVFRGNAMFSKGTTVRADTGTIVFGKNFWCNSDCVFQCTERIEFGDDCLLGWNIGVRDGDGHHITTNGAPSTSKPIEVGNHVWVAADVTLLKGTYIPSESVVASNSVVTKRFEGEHILVGGYPAKLLRKGVEWRL